MANVTRHGGSAMSTRLRVYPAPSEDLLEDTPDPAVRVRLGDLLPLVAMAQRMNFIWLKDFLDDEVCITEDLHEVLQTFRGCKPSA
jgi:hypothetical protein